MSRLLLLMGEITRRVIDVYEAPPYMPLVPLADPEVGVEEKIRLSRWPWTVDADVLDPACKKIRALAAFPNRLLEPRWQSFLFHAMNKIQFPLPQWTAYLQDSNNGWPQRRHHH